MEIFRLINSTMNSTILEKQTFPPTERIIVGTILIIVGVTAVIGNSLVLILVWRFRALRTYTNFLITNLAIADLGISVFGFPLSATSNFSNGWIMGSVGCQWYGFTGMLFGLGNIGFLTTISIDRYLLTCKHQTFLGMSSKHYVTLASIAWTNAAFWATVPLLGWCRYSIDPSGTSCTVNWKDKTALYTSYVWCVFIVCFLTPGSIITVCYFKTWKFIRSVGDGGAQENIEWTHEKQVAKMCAVAIAFFLLAWSPYAVVCLWAACGDPNTIPHYMSNVSSLFAKSSACFNPFLYALLNRRFRLAVQKLCGLTKTTREAEEIRLHQLGE